MFHVPGESRNNQYQYIVGNKNSMENKAAEDKASLSSWLRKFKER